MAARIALRQALKQKPAATLAKTDPSRYSCQKQHQRATERFVRRNSEGKPLGFESSRFAVQASNAAIRLPFIVHDNFIDGQMILQELSAHRQTEKAQFFNRKTAFELVDERQCQYRIAEEARLQHEDIFIADRRHLVINEQPR